MSPEVRRVLDKLDAVKVVAGGWIARCPAHKDGRPSLKVDLADDGRVLLKCYAGCEAAAIVETIGLELGDLFPPRKGEQRPRGRCISRTEYEVCDEGGVLFGTHICEVFESGEKSCTWQGPNGSSRLGRPLSAMPLYGIDDLNGSAAVVVTEGEKARDALRARRIAAVGTVTGASSVPGPDALRPILGRDVVLWGDRDAAGDAHMAKIAAALKELGQPAASIRRVVWDDAPPGGDAADWSGDRAGLLALLEAAAPWPFSANGTHDPGEAAEADAEPFHLTDLGNARRLVKAHGQDIRFCAPWKSWLIWDGRWRQDETGEIVRRAKRTVASIYAEASAQDDGKERAALVKHGLKSEGDARIRAMIALAESEPGIPLVVDDLDRDPWLLTVLNGTIDLRSGDLLPARREHLITKSAQADYDPNATCPSWESFLDRIMGGNHALISFLQCAAGYSLTGNTSERALFILHGVGKNGKSTMLEVLRTVLGDYARSTPAETLMAQRNDAIPHDIARLVGIRFVTAVEAEDERRFAEAKVKQLTGGDTISARKMYAELFDFVPAFKVWLSTNHKPVVRGTDEAMWDRLKLIPFGVRIPESEQDKGLRAKLLAEATGILAWMVRGCLDWQRNGLGEPEEVKAATSHYRRDMDILGRFIDERCFVATDAGTTAKHLYADYVSWCEENGEKPMSQTWLGRRLGERGFEKHHGEKARGYVGIGLLSGED